jgi:AraC-like DNA-binding protein
MPAFPLWHSVVGLRELGIDARPALARVGIAHVSLIPQEIPISLFHDFWVALREITGATGFGVRLAGLVRLERYAVFGELVASSATVGDAVLRAVRLIRLVASTLRLSFHLEGDHATLLADAVYPEWTHPETMEFVVCAIGVIARDITGREMRAMEVRFAHEAPEDTTPHEKLFGRVPRFGAPHSGYVFDSSLLLLPLIRPNLSLCAELEKQAEQLLAVERRATQLRLDVRAALSAELRGGSPTLERIAEVLDIHPKTLVRRLQIEGTSFRRLLDELRLQLAERYLRQPGLTTEEVAFLLGYSEKSAFNRAFRRWTGRPPLSYRENAAE